jgi:hypothetical protein
VLISAIKTLFLGYQGICGRSTISLDLIAWQWRDIRSHFRKFQKALGLPPLLRRTKNPSAVSVAVSTGTRII